MDTSRESSEEDGQECKEMEFEPQTCFSFNELLASDDLGPLDGGDSSTTFNKKVETSSMFLPAKNADMTSYVKHEPAISTVSAAAVEFLVDIVHVKNHALIFVVKHVIYGSTVIVHLGMKRSLEKKIGSAAAVGMEMSDAQSLYMAD
ncbi:hypothetical protein HAX54_027262 [Datura stramonium]|uniref:Uncharacterized protein n=1 Tax=Datura stramonium TaxID=4076 RepID=A0ABS8V285_DATST|nr:hypothetical protein [Datura stramonium]